MSTSASAWLSAAAVENSSATYCICHNCNWATRDYSRFIQSFLGLGPKAAREFIVAAKPRANITNFGQETGEKPAIEFYAGGELVSWVARTIQKSGKKVMVVARSLVKESLGLKHLLDFIPKEVQKGVNDPETLKRLAEDSKRLAEETAAALDVPTHNS